VPRPVRRPLATLFAAAALAGCATSAPGGPATPAQASASLARVVRADLRAHPAIPGEAVALLTPGVRAEAAAGYADVATRVPLTPDTPFRIASVTKTFVAAAALRLVERGDLELDGAIGPHLSPETAALLRDDGYDPDRITLRQLLDHTAGLFDFATGATHDRITETDPGHRWTRAEQLRLATVDGDPLGAPGTGYRYDDTGYLLVGEVVERATDRPLAAAVRDLDRFARLGLDHTWWETFEPAPVGTPPRAHQYAGTGYDNAGLDASSDLFGGGGLVSTVGDLARFFDALFDGEVFDDDDTLDAMLTVSGPGRSAGAALGIFEARIAGVRCWGHPGWWGTEAYHCPGRELTFALTVNQSDEASIDTAPVERAVMRLAR
jgi:D-alanyl-D-alanine carboxypeptidase